MSNRKLFLVSLILLMFFTLTVNAQDFKINNDVSKNTTQTLTNKTILKESNTITASTSDVSLNSLKLGNKLDTEYVLKVGNITDLATRNHNDLQNINGNESYQHLTTAEVSNITLKSGSLTQINTRNHNDLQNLNVLAAHPSTSITNDTTGYGKGLALTDNTMKLIADRVNQNGTPAFKTSKDKCPLMLNFKDGLADSTNGITPIGYSTATKRATDNFISNPDGSISCTLKQFDGDEGKFGSGVAVEESRTNLLLYSDDLTNAAWTKSNCTVTLDRILPDGRKLFKVTAIASGDAYIANSSVTTNSGVTYTFSLSVIANEVNSIFATNFYNLFLNNTSNYKKITKINNTIVNGQTRSAFAIGANLKTAGDTFYITSPQLEAGAFPTSYIATGATAVTRPVGKLSFPTSAIPSTKDFTLSFWIKPNFNYDTTANPYYLSYRNNDTTNVLTMYYYANKFTFALGSGSSIINSSAYASNADLQKEHHILIKKNGNVGEVYIDKVLIGSVTNATEIILPAFFELGYYSPDLSRSCNSIISNFAIFNYALTADEIANIYNAGLENKPVELTNGKTVSEADRLSPNIEAGSNKAQFVTDKTKCSLLLDFKGTLADKTRAINPIGSDAANKWVDNFVNDSTTKTSATNISCTLKQFEGDEGKFGSGIAVEESRTNLILYSDDLTHTSWTKSNCTVTLDRIENGVKIFKMTAVANGSMYIGRNYVFAAGTYSASVSLINTTGRTVFFGDGLASLVNTNTSYSKLTRIFGSGIFAGSNIIYQLGALSMLSGESIYFAMPQIELGAFPTSYIATGATAVTRPAGNLYFNEKLNATEGSLSFWYKPNYKYNDFASASDFPVIFEYDNNSRENIFSLSYRGLSSDAYKYTFGLANGNSKIYSIEYSALNFNDKTFNFVVKWDNTNIYFYINRILIGSATKTAFTADAIFRLGNIYNNTKYKAQGTISNLAIFNYALTADEISQIYNSGLEGKPIVTTNPINHQDVIREYAGTPNGNIMPMFFGETVYDTTNNAWYKSKKIDNSTFVNPAWLQISN